MLESACSLSAGSAVATSPAGGSIQSALDLALHGGQLLVRQALLLMHNLVEGRCIRHTTGHSNRPSGGSVVLATAPRP